MVKGLGCPWSPTLNGSFTSKQQRGHISPLFSMAGSLNRENKLVRMKFEYMMASF
jgi:hypothetical protein